MQPVKIAIVAVLLTQAAIGIYNSPYVQRARLRALASGPAIAEQAIADTEQEGD